MDHQKQDDRYEELYTNLLEYGLNVHLGNKKRIRIGLVILLLLPFILEVIRRLTDSDKIIFLLVWVFLMFALCIYLIGVEYLDDSARKILEDVTDREADFGELIPDSEMIEENISKHHDKVHARIHLRHERRQQRLKDVSERIRAEYRREDGDEDA